MGAWGSPGKKFLFVLSSVLSVPVCQYSFVPGPLPRTHLGRFLQLLQELGLVLLYSILEDSFKMVR